MKKYYYAAVVFRNQFLDLLIQMDTLEFLSKVICDQFQSTLGKKNFKKVSCQLSDLELVGGQWKLIGELHGYFGVGQINYDVYLTRSPMEPIRVNGEIVIQKPFKDATFFVFADEICPSKSADRKNYKKCEVKLELIGSSR